MKLFQPSKRMFLKMFLSMTIALVLLIMVLSYIYYTHFVNIGIRMAITNNMKLLSQISYSANYMNDNARSFAFSVFNDPEVTQMMYQSKEDVTGFYLNLDRLKRLVEMNPFIHSFYIYNHRLNQYYPIWGTPPASRAITFSDSELDRILLETARNPKNFKPIPRKLDLNVSDPNGNKKFVNSYTYILYDLSSPLSGPEGALIVNVKGEYLKKIIDSLQTNNSFSGTNTFIIDRNGMDVSEGNQFLSDISNQSYIQNIIRSEKSTGHFTDVIDHQRVLVTYVSSDVLDWKFINIMPYDTITGQMKAMQWATLVICLSVLLAAFLVSFFISRKLYNPLQNLLGNVAEMTHQTDANVKRMDEMALLKHAFTETYEKAILRDVAERDLLSVRKNEWFRDLLQNQMNAEANVDIHFKKYKILLEPSQNYLLISFRIDRYTEFSARYPAKDQRLLRYGITNVITEWFRRDFLCETIDMDKDLLLVIANVDESLSEEKLRKLFAAIEGVQSWSKEHYQKISLSAAVGYLHQDFHNLYQAYEEIIKIAQYRLILGYGIIIKPDLLRAQSMDPYKLLNEKEKRFIEAVTSGKKTELDSIYTEIVNELNQYTYDSIMATLIYLTYLIYDTLNRVERNSNHFYKFDINFNDFTQDIYQLDTLKEINEKFLGLFHQISLVIGEKKSKRNTTIADTIAGIVKINYWDKSLCLESIASTMNMSKIYIGKLFRDAYGQSVAEYITDLRLQKAVELLHQGKTNLGDLIEEIGLENKSYFYKLFKAKMGLSFGEYKDKHLSSIVLGRDEG